MLTHDKESPAGIKIILRKLSCTNIMTIALLLALTACGGSGDGSNPDTAAKVVAADGNYFTVTKDDYGLLSPNYYYSTDNAKFWSIQANVANGENDPNFRTVMRIDITKSEDFVNSSLKQTFSIENNSFYKKFPGTFYVFNGQAAVFKKVEHGTISFSAGSASAKAIQGTFDVFITDYDSKIIPSPQYHIQGVFKFDVGTYGPAVPLVSQIYPVNGKETYEILCSRCHNLGDYDPVVKSASNLSQRGAELPIVYPGTVPEHQGITLTPQITQDLRVFLNAW